MAGTLTGVALVVDLGATLLLITLGIALVPWRDLGPADRTAIEQPGPVAPCCPSVAPARFRRK